MAKPNDAKDMKPKENSDLVKAPLDNNFKLVLINILSTVLICILLIGINGSVNDLKGITEKAIYKNKYGTVEKFLDKNDNYIMLWNDGRRCLNDDGTIYELLIKLEYEEINEKQYISSSNRMEYYVKLDEFAYLEINDLGYAKIYVDSAKYYWGYYYYFKTDAASASYIYELASGKSEPYLLG